MTHFSSKFFSSDIICWPHFSCAVTDNIEKFFRLFQDTFSLSAEWCHLVLDQVHPAEQSYRR